MKKIKERVSTSKYIWYMITLGSSIILMYFVYIKFYLGESINGELNPIIFVCGLIDFIFLFYYILKKQDEYYGEN